MAVQRGNAACVLGTVEIDARAGLDEILYYCFSDSRSLITARDDRFVIRLFNLFYCEFVYCNTSLYGKFIK